MFVQKLFEKKSGKTLLYFATGKRINGVTKKRALRILPPPEPLHQT